MAKVKEFYVSLPKIYRRDTLDKCMFAFVLGYRYSNFLHVFTVKQAIEKFAEDFNLTEEEYPIDSAMVTWYKMFNEYKELR